MLLDAFVRKDSLIITGFTWFMTRVHWQTIIQPHTKRIRCTCDMYVNERIRTCIGWIPGLRIVITFLFRRISDIRLLNLIQWIMLIPPISIIGVTSESPENGQSLKRRILHTRYKQFLISDIHNEVTWLINFGWRFHIFIVVFIVFSSGKSMLK